MARASKIGFARPTDEFFSVLRQRVRAYIDENKTAPNGNAMMWLKVVLTFVCLFGGYYWLVFAADTFLAAAVAAFILYLGLLSTGLNVQHDAAHNALSSKKWINNLLGYSLDLIGGSTYLWKFKHNKVHHTYTNIPGADGDIEQEGVVRLSPGQKYKPIHRHQWLYATFLYGLLTLGWIYVSDYQKIVLGRVSRHEMPKMPRRELISILAFKAFHLFYSFILPIFIMGHTFWVVLLFYLAIQFMLSLSLSLIFQLAHIYEGVSYPALDDKEKVEYSWAEMQLVTTANFAPDSALVTHFVGGLNFQVTHHLFPNVCHVHYPAINEIIKETCVEFGKPYYEYKTIWGALKAHYRQLWVLGRPEYVMENLPDWQSSGPVALAAQRDASKPN